MTSAPGSNTSSGGQFAVSEPVTGRPPRSVRVPESFGSDASHSRLHSLPWGTRISISLLSRALTVPANSSSTTPSMVLVTTNSASIVDSMLSRVAVTSDLPAPSAQMTDDVAVGRKTPSSTGSPSHAFSSRTPPVGAKASFSPCFSPLSSTSSSTSASHSSPHSMSNVNFFVTPLAISTGARSRPNSLIAWCLPLTVTVT